MSCHENNGSKAGIIHTARLMFERNLTDVGGGNISVKTGDRIYITATQSGEKKHWELSPDDIIVTDAGFNVIEGNPHMISSERPVHFGIYRDFPEYGAVIHAHGVYLLAFACASKPILPYTDQYEYFIGNTPVECIRYIQGGTDELSAEIMNHFREKRKLFNKRGIAVMIPKHGIFIAAGNIEDAFVMLETIEFNAKILLFSKLL